MNLVLKAKVGENAQKPAAVSEATDTKPHPGLEHSKLAGAQSDRAGDPAQTH
jgi:hypothetical protein